VTPKELSVAEFLVGKALLGGTEVDSEDIEVQRDPTTGRYRYRPTKEAQDVEGDGEAATTRSLRRKNLDPSANQVLEEIFEQRKIAAKGKRVGKSMEERADEIKAQRDKVLRIPDHPKAVDWLTSSANHGYAQAKLALGCIWLYGFAGGTKNWELARSWLTAAAEGGEPGGSLMLGIGIMENSSSDDLAAMQGALSAFQQASERGDPEGSYRLAHGLYLGIGGEVDVERSMKALQHAVAGDEPHPAALYMLALLHRPTEEAAHEHPEEKQSGILPDAEAFMDCLVQSARLGHPEALYCLADIYLHGTDGVEVNPQVAAGYYRQAGERGHADALCSLGAVCFNGIGMEASHAAAFRCYLAASKLGSVAALSNLGSMYWNGQGVEQNRELAMECLEAIKRHEAEGNT